MVHSCSPFSCINQSSTSSSNPLARRDQRLKGVLPPRCRDSLAISEGSRGIWVAFFIWSTSCVGPFISSLYFLTSHTNPSTCRVSYPTKSWWDRVGVLTFRLRPHIGTEYVTGFRATSTKTTGSDRSTMSSDLSPEFARLAPFMHPAISPHLRINCTIPPYPAHCYLSRPYHRPSFVDLE